MVVPSAACTCATCNAGNLDEAGCGAESDPRKNLGLPSRTAARRAARSEGNLASGLQNPREVEQAPSMVRARWCGVMVATTFGGRDLTCLKGGEGSANRHAGGETWLPARRR